MKKYSNNKAIVYLAFGEFYLAMALLSIKTVRKFDRETKIILITNINFNPIKLEYWQKNKNDILYIDDYSKNNREYKTNLIKYIDAEKIAFFDSDTMILSNFDIAWKYLDYFDIALKLNSSKQKKSGKGDIKILNNKFKIRDLPHFNSGVMFIKKSDATIEFFNYWNKSYKLHNVEFDQVSLVEALFDSNIKILPLTSEWNYFPDINYYFGKVKSPIIFHYTNRISYVLENELMQIADLIKLDKILIKQKISKKRSDRLFKIGRKGWLKLCLLWRVFYNSEKKRLNLN